MTPEDIEEVEEESEGTVVSKMDQMLDKSINDLELSVRSANCLSDAGIETLRELVVKSEAEMLKYRNFGKRSLTEIVQVLETLGLSLEMSLSSDDDLEKNEDNEEV